MNILVIGQRGMGKSTLALFLARRIQQNRKAHVIVIFDPKRTYKTIPHTSDLDELNDWLEHPPADVVAFQPFAQNLSDKKSVDEVADAFTEFIEALGIDFHLGMGESATRTEMAPVVLVVDEAWFLQAGASAHPKLETLVRLADSKNFFLIEAAHRPKDFSTRIRAQVDEMYLFQQWLDEDLEIIEQWCGAEVADKVRSLPSHHVIKFIVSQRRYEVWSHPEGWYFNLGDDENGHADNADAGEAETEASGSSRES